MQLVLKLGTGERGGGVQKLLNQGIFKSFIRRNESGAGKPPNLVDFEPIVCQKAGREVHGYEATVLVDICDGILEAKNTLRLTPKQEITAKQCEALVRVFAKTGIIALVHEATGYQEVREKTLQEILKGYIAEEVLEWQKTFHSPFYEQMSTTKFLSHLSTTK